MNTRFHSLWIPVGSFMVLLSLASSACSSSKSSEPQNSPATLSRLQRSQTLGAGPTTSAGTDDPWLKKLWVEKTLRALRGDQEIGAEEDIQSYLSMDRSEMVQKLEADPRFGDAIYDFNLYFMGIKRDSIRDANGKLRVDLTTEGGSRAAILSAQAAVRNGDYFGTLFKAQLPYTVVPLFRVSNNAPPEAAMASEIDQAYADFLSRIDSLIQLVPATAGAPFDFSSFCNSIGSIDPLSAVELGSMWNPGIAGTYAISTWFKPLFGACGFLEPDVHASPMTAAGTISALQLVRDHSKKAIDLVKTYLPENYEAPNIDSIRTDSLATLPDMDPAQIAADYEGTALSDLQTQLQNSSTNRNRKRAAYIFNRYLCDDLTPINVAVPAEHATSGAHGSSTSCYACHFKLDPMAGFFKNYGGSFTDYSSRQQITFDDFAQADFATYTAGWKAPAGSGRTWDIGLIRSTTDPTKNQYGESLQDLFDILREAPEVKRCMAKRAYEYLVGPSQAIDSGYLDELASGFSAGIQVDSSKAIRDLFAKIVLSNAFMNADPVATQCYDFATGADPLQSLPCQVGSTLKTYCASCHSSTSGPGHLDLSRWVTLADGKPGFPHLDSAGQSVPFATTGSEILDRLGSQDENKRMPLGGFIPDPEKEKIFHWVTDALSQGGNP